MLIFWNAPLHLAQLTPHNINFIKFLFRFLTLLLHNIKKNVYPYESKSNSLIKSLKIQKEFHSKRVEDQIVLLKILKFECPVLSSPNTYTQSGRALKNQTNLSWKLILCTTFCSGLAYMMQWKKGGGPNCAIENLAKCNNPRDLPHNSDLIKCNWDLAMSLQCPKSF